MKIIFILFLFAVYSMNVQAQDCETGYACSIDDLIEKEKNSQDELIKDYDNLFKEGTSPDKLLEKPEKTTDYNELFIYRTTILKQ